MNAVTKSILAYVAVLVFLAAMGTANVKWGTASHQVTPPVEQPEEPKEVTAAREAVFQVFDAENRFASDEKCGNGLFAATIGQLTATHYAGGDPFLVPLRTRGYKIAILPGDVPELDSWESCTSYAPGSLVRSFIVEAVPLPGYADFPTIAFNHNGEYVNGAPEK